MRTALVLAGCFWAASACERSHRSAAAPTAALTAASPHPEVRPAPERCGMCFAHSWEDAGARGYGTDAARSALDELKALGIRHLSLTPFGWMSSLEDPRVVSEVTMAGAETEDRVRAAARDARARGMTVLVKPHLWVRRGEWPGELRFAAGPQADTFFATYRDFILRWARLAEEVGADALLIGLELRGLSAAHPDAFRALIATIRGVYRGRIGYGANWDEVEQVTFWDTLDFIGVQLYAPLRGAEAPLDPGALRLSAERWRDRYEAVSRRFGKPLWLTEAGFTNRVGVTVDPHLWPEQRSAKRTPEGDAEQRLAYSVLLSVYGASPLVDRIYLWKWFTDVHTDEEPSGFGYMPRGKPAGEVLRTFCSDPTARLPRGVGGASQAAEKAE
ncbi:MAG: glycoside hydrolase family 113 [Bradymonadia bacterium]